MNKLTCPYCGANANLQSSTVIYERDYGLMYICSNWPTCDAYVGVHKDTTKPLGTMANAELRKWRNRAHGAFDPLWQRKLARRKKERGDSYKKCFARGSGYKWLSKQLNIPFKDCHIAMFDVSTCKRVVQICEPYSRINHGIHK